MFQSQSHTLIVKRSSLLCHFTNFCYHSCFPMSCEPPSNWSWTHTLTAVPMAVAITTTLTQWWGVWTESSQLTSTFQAVLPMQRHWCMLFSSLGRESGGHAPSKCGIESNPVALESCHMLFLSPPWNSHCKSPVLIFMIVNFNEYIRVANLSHFRIWARIEGMKSFLGYSGQCEQEILSLHTAPGNYVWRGCCHAKMEPGKVDPWYIYSLQNWSSLPKLLSRSRQWAMLQWVMWLQEVEQLYFNLPEKYVQ